MVVIAGIAMIAAGFLLFYIALPREGHVAPFLRLPFAEVAYSLLVTCLFGIGLLAIAAGIIGATG